MTVQIPILNGIYVDQVAEFRTSYPRNLVPVPKQTGISEGFLAPADGLQKDGDGPGLDRGGFNWKGQLYRVMGTKLCRIAANNSITVLGDVGGAGPVTMDESFDVLGIASDGRLWYWDGTALTALTDPDAGVVIDARWIAGYWLITDGETIAVTELNDRYAVNPLKYGSAEADPDPVMAVDELRNEAYALGRYTIEAFQNVGGTNFPFRRIDGALVTRGVIGTRAYCQIGSTFAFLGSGKGEAPGFYLMASGDSQKLSTAEIDKILGGYTEAQLSSVVVEKRVYENHSSLLIHLPDQCWVYDLSASSAAGEPVWYSLTSSTVGLGTYRARGLCWCYNRWNVGDPTGTAYGRLTDQTMEHYGQVVGWEFGTLIVYNAAKGAIVHNLELVGTPGRVKAGDDPVIWTSYSLDGETWSQERSTAAGKQGQRNKRIAWRKLGKMRLYRMQRFRGTSDARMSFARLEVEFEALNG